MSGTKVALNCGDVISDFTRMLSGVSPAASRSVLLIHPRYEANRATRAQAKLLEKLRGLHGYDYARSVVNRARAQVPRMQMARNYYDLLRVLAAFQVRYDVVAFGIWKLLRRQCQVHSHAPLCCVISHSQR